MYVIIAAIKFFLLTWVMQIIDEQPSEVVIHSNDSLLQYASSNLVSKCDSALSRFGGNPDSAMFDNSQSTDALGVTPQKGNRPDEWGLSYAPNTNDFRIWDKNPFVP